MGRIGGKETDVSEEMLGRSADLTALMLLYRVRDFAYKSQIRILSEYGLTPERYVILAAVKYSDDHLRVTDIAPWLGHNEKTHSRVVNNMVKAGLLNRVQDLPDRRELRLTITPKGEEALRLATPAVGSLIANVLPSLSDDEKHTLIDLPEKVRGKAVEYLSQGEGIPAAGAYGTNDLSNTVTILSKCVRTSTA